MTRYNEIGKGSTAVFTDDGFTRVVYHETQVVKFNHESIILDSGGWKTNTTKTRMNQTSNQFDLGYQVYQVDFEWYVDFQGQSLPFEDGMTLARN